MDRLEELRLEKERYQHQKELIEFFASRDAYIKKLQEEINKKQDRRYLEADEDRIFGKRI